MDNGHAEDLRLYRPIRKALTNFIFYGISDLFKINFMAQFVYG